MNMRCNVHAAFLPALAILCAAGTVSAQNFVSTPAPSQVITNHRQVSSLVLAHQPPEYPAVAKVNYIEGQVQLEITVNGDGRVASAHVLTGNPLLAAAALKAVSHWVYRPLATPAGPVGFTTRVRLKFSLHHGQTELTARQAERDFQRQVKPPQLVNPPNQTQWGDVVRMRLLVNDQGQVVDMDAARLDKPQLDAVSENMRGWTFHPARWGTMPIAAYLNIDVPVNAPGVSPVASISLSR